MLGFSRNCVEGSAFASGGMSLPRVEENCWSQFIDLCRVAQGRLVLGTKLFVFQAPKVSLKVTGSNGSTVLRFEDNITAPVRKSLANHMQGGLEHKWTDGFRCLHNIYIYTINK